MPGRFFASKDDSSTGLQVRPSCSASCNHDSIESAKPCGPYVYEHIGNRIVARVFPPPSERTRLGRGRSSPEKSPTLCNACKGSTCGACGYTGIDGAKRPAGPLEIAEGYSRLTTGAALELDEYPEIVRAAIMRDVATMDAQVSVHGLRKIAARYTCPEGENPKEWRRMVKDFGPDALRMARIDVATTLEPPTDDMAIDAYQRARRGLARYSKGARRVFPPPEPRRVLRELRDLQRRVCEVTP